MSRTGRTIHQLLSAGEGEGPDCVDVCEKAVEKLLKAGFTRRTLGLDRDEMNHAKVLAALENCVVVKASSNRVAVEFGLKSRDVDWDEEFEDWDLTCPFCKGNYEKTHRNGENEYCEHCEDGLIPTYWNTVWKPTNQRIDRRLQRRVMAKSGCILMRNLKDDEWWLSLGGCGMDMTPHLAYAFLLVDGTIPMEFVNNLRPDYHAYLGESAWKRVVQAAREQLKATTHQAMRQLTLWDGKK